MSDTSLILATRGSELALWQTHHVMDLLHKAWPELSCEKHIVVTKGDRILDKPLPEIGGKGLFTAELEALLRSGDAQIAVHSLKDLPTEDEEGLMLGAICSRADVRDALVSFHGYTVETLPEGAVIGTSSNRRAAQLRAVRPDLQFRSIRGNVGTRVRKVQEGQVDAAILALAGLRRLGMEEVVSQILPLEVMLPAPGQGALAIQCALSDDKTRQHLAAIHDEEAKGAILAERTFLAALGGGCSAPVGAFAKRNKEGQWWLRVAVGLDDGRVLRLEEHGSDPISLGRTLAQKVVVESV